MFVFRCKSVLQRTYIVASLRLPETNVLGMESNDVSVSVHDACSCTSSSHIDANVVVNSVVKLIARVHRHAARPSTRLRSGVVMRKSHDVCMLCALWMMSVIGLGHDIDIYTRKLRGVERFIREPWRHSSGTTLITRMTWIVDKVFTIGLDGVEGLKR